MSLPALISDPEIGGDLAVETPVPAVPAQRLPHGVARRVLGGTSVLAAGVFMERGLGFAANILAARFAGAAVFGAYALAIGTANNISTYAAGGIGATATRFSGKYPYGSRGYATLARVLAVVSLVSASLAGLALWLGAGPIAHLLHKTSLTGLLRWAAISAVGIILLECARGFFVGQRRLVAVVLLSLIVGAGMVTMLPLMASIHNPIHMIVAQGAITLSAVAACILLARPLGLFDLHAGVHHRLAFLPMLKEVWSFGFVQLAGLIGSNLAGWWLTALVARSDTSLVQMSFFAIASQLRNLAGLGPSLLTEGSYATMADPDGEHSRTPQYVMSVCTYGSTLMALLFAAPAIIIVPWALRALYGQTYSNAAVTAAIALAVAVVHMGNAPAAARLTIVSIRASGVINTTWAAFVALSGTIFLLHGGNAAEAMAIYFAGHVLSAALVLTVLARKDHVPAGMVNLFLLGTAAIVSLVAFATWRNYHPAQALPVSALMAATLLFLFAALFLLGRRHGWLPSAAAVRRLLHTAPSYLRRLMPSAAAGGSHGA
jgi:O-antigen/teichoic acid export membrane protein